MTVQKRSDLLVKIGNYMKSSDEEWQSAKSKASAENNWFIPEFVALSVNNIADNFLQPQQLQALVDKYGIPKENTASKKVGIVMAGNIPLVGFHDLLCVFITGHIAVIKPSTKDEALIKHLVKKLIEWDAEVGQLILIQPMLKNCDAYIATGSDNTGRYFEYYFQKYPHIIRKNRTSVAILTGNESDEELDKLADDVHLYFGLGCRNVTKLYVPEEYNFERIINAFKKYNHLFDLNKYKNNYDYHLAAHLLNNRYYMTSGSTLVIEDASLFSPISQLNYEFYQNEDEVYNKLQNNEQVQCVIGSKHISFGEAQCPQLNDYADGVDTIDFLMKI